LARREFSFTLAGDVYLRYQSFETSSEFRKELVKLCPHKIDIGAVYSTAPKKHRAILPSSFKFDTRFISVKCKVLLQDWVGSNPNLMLSDKPIEAADEFVYLGSCIILSGLV
ncbi:hypothetical protein T265_15217, partial [Opisthorchis viverrini]